MKEEVPRRTTVEHPLIHDRGRGPELVGTRITVYDLIPYLEDPPFSDEEMLKLWPSVTAEGLAALKAYIADHRDEVMAKHWEIEARMIREWAAQCTPENLARWDRTRREVEAFRDWILDRQRDGTLPPPGERRAAFEAWQRAGRPARVGADS
jgi:uncharacterized protein (DUF433 family)